MVEVQGVGGGVLGHLHLHVVSSVPGVGVEDGPGPVPVLPVDRHPGGGLGLHPAHHADLLLGGVSDLVHTHIRGIWSSTAGQSCDDVQNTDDGRDDSQIITERDYGCGCKTVKSRGANDD